VFSGGPGCPQPHHADASAGVGALPPLRLGANHIDLTGQELPEAACVDAWAPIALGDEQNPTAERGTAAGGSRRGC
jgi:hypothetical protein